MKIIKNEKLIKRNSQIGQWTSLAALVVLGVGMYISFTRTDLFTYSIVALLGGFILTQVGMYMGNRYGRSPRPDEKLDAGLKGLQNEFVMYHYMAPASHLLVGPAGIWVLLPYHQSGKVVFKKNRWKMSGGGFLQGYMRIFGQESIGRPDIEMDSEVNGVKKFFEKNLEGMGVPEINTLMVFTSDNVEIDVDESPVPAMKLKEIKEFFRKKAKEKVIGQTQLAAIKAALPE